MDEILPEFSVHILTFLCLYYGTHSLKLYCTYVCTYVHLYMYPDAWAFSINYKSADRSTFTMYWGTFVMYSSFWKWH